MWRGRQGAEYHTVRVEDTLRLLHPRRILFGLLVAQHIDPLQLLQWRGLHGRLITEMTESHNRFDDTDYGFYGTFAFGIKPFTFGTGDVRGTTLNS